MVAGNEIKEQREVFFPIFEKRSIEII